MNRRIENVDGLNSSVSYCWHVCIVCLALSVMTSSGDHMTVRPHAHWEEKGSLCTLISVSLSAPTRSKRGTPPNIIDIVPGSQQHQLLSLRLLNDCQKYVFLVVSPRLTPSRITTQNFPMDRLVLEQRSVVISVLFYKFIHYLFGWLCVLGREKQSRFIRHKRVEHL